MAKSGVLQLVDDLSSNQADATQKGKLYTDVVREMARDESFLSQATLVAVAADDATYSLPSSVGRLLGVVYDDHILSRSSQKALSSINQHWRDEKGVPQVFTEAHEANGDFRIYPTPDRASGAFSFPTGEPLGVDYPLGALVVFHTEERTDAQDWLDLAIALEVTAREFSRESDHRDAELAEGYRQLSRLFFTLVS